MQCLKSANDNISPNSVKNIDLMKCVCILSKTIITKKKYLPRILKKYEAIITLFLSQDFQKFLENLKEMLNQQTVYNFKIYTHKQE